MQIERLTFKLSNNFYAIVFEDFVFVRRFGQLVRQVLARKVQVLVQTCTPLGTIGYIVDNSIARDPHARTAFARVAM